MLRKEPPEGQEPMSSGSRRLGFKVLLLVVLAVTAEADDGFMSCLKASEDKKEASVLAVPFP